MGAILRRLKSKLNGHTGVAVLLVLFVACTYIFTSYRLDQYREIMYQDRLQALQSTTTRHRHGDIPINNVRKHRPQHENKAKNKHHEVVKATASVGVPKVVQDIPQNTSVPKKHPKAKRKLISEIEHKKQSEASILVLPRDNPVTATSKNKHKEASTQVVPAKQKSQKNPLKATNSEKTAEVPPKETQHKQSKKRKTLSDNDELVGIVEEQKHRIPEKKISRKANKIVHQAGT